MPRYALTKKMFKGRNLSQMLPQEGNIYLRLLHGLPSWHQHTHTRPLFGPARAHTCICLCCLHQSHRQYSGNLQLMSLLTPHY